MILSTDLESPDKIADGHEILAALPEKNSIYNRPYVSPAQGLEYYKDLAVIIKAAIDANRLSAIRQRILQLYLCGQEDDEIAAELDLHPQQVQRHKYKIREELKCVFQNLGKK